LRVSSDSFTGMSLDVWARSGKLGPIEGDLRSSHVNEEDCGGLRVKKGRKRGMSAWWLK